MEGEREVGGGEDGQGFDEDVGDGFVAGEVRVKLVSGVWVEVNDDSKFGSYACKGRLNNVLSDRANNLGFIGLGSDSFSGCPCR